MICNRVEIRNFRNSSHAEVEFTEGVNVLLGSNAQGKTNLLEAVYLACTSKSFRASNDSQLIKFGEGSAMISVDFTDTRKQNITFNYELGKRRKIEINKNKITKVADMIGRFKCVLFCPEHLTLIKGAPSVRRDFLDFAISQLRPMYIVSLQKYERILKVRNTLLKNALDDRETYEKTIEFWNEQLCHEAAIISRMRESYVKQVEAFMTECFIEMSKRTGRENEVPRLIYRGSCPQDSYEDLTVTRDNYMKLLHQRPEREIFAGTSLYGVHRDDVEIMLGDKSAKDFASQGQQRSLALCLKLAEGEIVKKDSGEYPVFLLDDVLSELDEGRRKYLIDEIKNKQVIMTSCESDPELYKTANVIMVKDGIYTGIKE
jgi:DNA replication and repair protein RecF